MVDDVARGPSSRSPSKGGSRGSAGEGEDSTAYFDDTEDVGATLAEIEADERQRSKDFIDDTPVE